MTPPHLEIDLSFSSRDTALDVDLALSDPVIAAAGGDQAGQRVFLDLVAGFLRPDRGRIRVAGRSVVDVEQRIWVSPGKRGVGLVPRGGALFPHLTVEENLAFGVRRLQPAVLDRFQAIVHTFNLAPILGLKPCELDPRESLFAATARALIPNPHLVLLEEPLDRLEPAQARDDLDDLVERILEYDTPVLFTGREVDGLAVRPRVIGFAEGRASTTWMARPDRTA